MQAQSQTGAGNGAIESILFSLGDGGKSSDMAPLSPFMHHLWARHRSFFPGSMSLSNAADRAWFVYWYIETFTVSRRPYDCLLSDDLVAWLNTPVLDLTTEISTRPSVDGERPCYDRKFLTRYMLHVWRTRARGHDVLQASGYYHFVAWYALHLAFALNLNRSLLPDAIVALLNKPASNASIPLTLGMLVNGMARWPERYSNLNALSREELIARAFEGLPDMLYSCDFRLLPEYVTEFWLSKPFHDVPTVTALEYVAARVVEPQSGVVEGYGGMAGEQYALKLWFLTAFRVRFPHARLFAGFSPHEIPPERADASPMTLSRKTVYIYRDRTTISGQSRAGSATARAVQLSNKIVEVDFSLPRNRMADEFKSNESKLCASSNNLHILNLNPEYAPECVMLHLDKIRPGDYLIGQFYWELSDIATVHECALSLMDELWVASQYLVEVYSQHFTKPVINMGQAVAPTVMSRTYSRASFGLPSTAYMFLFSFDAGSVIRRKNPLGAVRAFKAAFPKGDEQTILVLKTRNTSSAFGDADRLHWAQVLAEAAQDDRIFIIDDTYTDEQLAGLKTTCDCYVSLHCSEGFGFGPAEAMALGKPVIVTNYSGVCDFCNSENAMLVDYELTLLDANSYPYLDDFRSYYWGTPDLDSAARAMRELYHSPETGRRLGFAGQRTIAERYSVDALRRRYEKRLIELGFIERRRSESAYATPQGSL